MTAPSDLARTEVMGVGIAVRDVAVWLSHHPAPDEKLPALDFRETGGGPVATALVTLARWGRRCAFAGLLGDDASGRFVSDGLQAEGVNVAGLVLAQEATTPLSVILNVGGHRTICEWRQAEVPLDPEALDRVEPALEVARVLLVDARMAPAQVAAARKVRGSGGFVVLDAGHPRPGVEALLPCVDVAILSHDFPAAIPDRPAHEDFLAELVGRLAPDGLRIAGLTLGDEGCLLMDGAGATVRVPGHHVEVRDTTGAGDVFHAGFVHALLDGADLETAARFANAAAALKCRGLSGRPALPSPEEIRRFAGLPVA